MKKALILLLITVLCLVFVACTPIVLKINFVVDGQVYKTVYTSGNETISMPQNPSKEGYTFDGWYWDDGKWKQPFTANSLLDAPLSSDMNVYAKWTEDDNKTGNKPSDKDHTHIVGTDSGVAPTCTSTGLTTGEHCIECGEVLLVQNVIPALGHTVVIDEAVPPTCTNPGITEGRHCSVCNAIIQSQIFISPFSHTEVTDDAIDPTCTQSGLTKGKHCSTCNEVLVTQQVVEALGHDYSTTVTNPTCTTKGYTTYRCHCGNTYKDDYVNAIGHNYSTTVTAPTCTTEGYTTYRCHCGNTYEDDYVNPIEHNYSTTVTAPTCTAEGYTTYRCHCGNTYEDDYVDAIDHVGGVATCTTFAKCDVCGTEYGELLPHIGTPTCTESANCEVCGQKFGTPRGHALEQITIAGNIVYTCRACENSYSLDNPYFFDGSNFDGMTGVVNSSNGFTVSEGDLPAVVTDENGNEYYQLLNTTGQTNYFALWVPHGYYQDNDSGFSCANGAAGVISFKINSYTTGGYSSIPTQLSIVDARGTSIWSWSTCGAVIFRICPPDANGNVTITGLNDLVLTTVKADEDNFTGWLDVKIFIQLNTDNTTSIYYYINEECVAIYSGVMPIITNKISALYLLGHTTPLGSGVMFDDFVFGYSTGDAQ